MELKYVNCQSNSVQMKLPCGFHRDDDIIIYHSNNEITTWDIGDPLNIRQIGSCAFEHCCPRDVLYKKTLFIYYKTQMQRFDVSDYANIKALDSISLDEPGVLSLDIADDGTIWAVSRSGAIGTYNMNGKFNEHIPAIAELLERGAYDLHLKVVGNLVAVAHQDYGIWVYGKDANGKLQILKQVKKGMTSCFGTPITSICDNKMLLLISFMGMVPISIYNTEKITKLKEFTPKYEFRNNKGLGIIDCGQSTNSPLAHDILVYGQKNDIFELSLLEISEQGITCKDSVRLKHAQFDRPIDGMFLKDNYIIMFGTLPAASGFSIEVYELTK